MLRRHAPLALIACALLWASPAPADWQLVWSDEFDGSSLDLSKWEHQQGTGCPNLCGWGNNELQFYRSNNTSVGGGFLTIEAREEGFADADYTSSRIRTRGQGDWTYGRFEMRAKLPIGQGMWSAFWMLPTNSPYGGWAASGEIDIMEGLGHLPQRVYGTIHYGGEWPENTSSGQSLTLSGDDFHSNFHVFALEWEPTELRWYVDGKLFATQTDWGSDGNPLPAPFDTDFHLLLNLAVGGNFPGNPDGSTTFPQQYIVDYVRVYEDESEDCFVMYDGLEHANPYGNGWFAFNGNVGGGGVNGNLVDLPPFAGETASLETGWGSGGSTGFVGGFGRSRAMELGEYTHFEFWILPDGGQHYELEVNLQDDDNGDDFIPGSPDGQDDEFQTIVEVGPPGSDVLAGGGWQQVVLPLSSFVDDNSYHYGGNGVLDAIAVGDGGNGMMRNVVFAILSLDGANITFRADRLAFTRRNASIEGTVWDDLDGDGNVDGGEAGLDGVDLQLRDLQTNFVVAAQTTDVDGDYAFDELGAGDYRVEVDLASLPQGYDPSFDPDGIQTVGKFVAQLACDEAGVGNFGFRSELTPAPGVRRQDQLFAATPNPFNPSTTLRFELGQPARVELKIYDSLGRLVDVLADSELPAGEHRREWNGKDLRGRVVASGVYFATLRTPSSELTQRMVLLK